MQHHPLREASLDALEDPARLRALREADLFDTPHREPFDRLTRLTARVFATPLALVNLIDDRRQLSVSCFAPPGWPEEREAALEDSFCKHVVVSQEPLLIEDTLENPLVSSSVFVTGLGLRSYLAAPLATRDGHVLGTLCVADFVPRTWTPEQMETLQDLAASVVTEIEIRRSLQASEQRYHSIVESIHDYSIMKLGPDGRIRAWNTGAICLTGYAPEEVLGRHVSLLFRPEDAAAGEPEAELAEALEMGRAEREGWRVRKDGSQFWAYVVVTPVLAEEGHLAGFVRVVRDLTKQREAEERERELIREQAARAEAEAAEWKITSILESVTDAFLAFDREWRVTYVNQRGEALLRTPREELLGSNFGEDFPACGSITTSLPLRTASRSTRGTSPGGSRRRSCCRRCARPSKPPSTASASSRRMAPSST